MVTAHLQLASGTIEAFNNSLEDLESMLDVQGVTLLLKKYGKPITQLDQQRHFIIVMTLTL